MTPAQRSRLRSFSHKSIEKFGSSGYDFTPSVSSPHVSDSPLEIGDLSPAQDPEQARFEEELKRVEASLRQAREQARLQAIADRQEAVKQLRKQRDAAAAHARQVQAQAQAQAKAQAQAQAKAQAFQNDWQSASEENAVQDDWQDASAEDSIRDQYNPIDQFARSPVSQMVTSSLPHGMRDNARRLMGMAGQAYGVLPFSRRRQVHALGMRAAALTSGFVPKRAAGLVQSVGAQFGFSPAASTGLAGGAIAGAGAGMMLRNVGSMRESGKAIAENVTQGIRDGLGGVAEAGAMIGKVLSSSALAPFGKSGSAIGSAGGAAMGAIGGIGGAGLNAVSGTIGALGGIAGGAAGIGLGAVGAGAGMLMGGPMVALIGGIVMTGIGMIAGKIIAAVTEIFSGILAAAGKMAGELGKVIAAGLQSAIDVVKDTLETLLQYGKRIASLVENTGMSAGTAGRAMANSRALGISDGDADKMFGGDNVIFQQSRSAMIGASGEPGSPEFFRSAQARYQELMQAGGGNPIAANMVFNTAGYGAMIPQMNYSPELMDYSLSTSQRMQSAFDVDPEKMREANQQMGVLMGLFGQFTDLVKVKFAQELFPFLSGVFTRLIDYLGENSEQIADFIKNSVKFLVEDVPVHIASAVAFMVEVLGTLGTFIGDAADWLSERLPALTDFFDMVIGKIESLLGINPESSSAPQTTGVGANPQATPKATRTVRHNAPGYIRIPMAIAFGFLGAAALGGGSLGPGVVPGGLGGYAFGSHVANRFFGSTEEVPVSPEMAARQKKLRGIGEQARGFGERQSDLASKIDAFGQDWKENSKQFLSGVDSLNKTLKDGLDVNVSSEVKISPTQDFLAQTVAYGAYAQWRKMSGSVG